MTFFYCSNTGGGNTQRTVMIMKLGEHKTLKNGGSIREIWLTKWKPTKKYQVWGLHIGKDGKATGWCVLFSGTLKQARNYATLWN